MYFTLTLNIDSSVSRSWFRFPEVNETPEKRFWHSFREKAKSEGRSGELTTDIDALHARIRKVLPETLKHEVVRKLRVLLLNEPEAEGTKREEIRSALETLEIHIKSIRGGSLEILLFAWGFAKLISLTGISPDDFSKCLEIVAPVAMNAIFGTTVPLEADAKPALDPAAAESVRAAEVAGSRSSVIQVPSAAPYFIPAGFGLAVFGFAMWAFATVSGELAAERKDLTGYVNKEAENIGKERAAIAEKLSSLISAQEMALAGERRTVASAQKTLFDAQSEFIRKVDFGNQSREAAMIDFVKSHLALGANTRPVSAPPDGSTTIEVHSESRIGRKVRRAARAAR